MLTSDNTISQFDTFKPTHCLYIYPANTRHQTNAGLLLAHRLRRWPNIKPTLVRCLVFAGYLLLREEADRAYEREAKCDGM